ncbi:hypothetical protein BVX97_06515 [bacterium E08(2017)]|nr:hypothetical protein BVX97_06515 [bacterium E08(2017)]
MKNIEYKKMFSARGIVIAIFIMIASACIAEKPNQLPSGPKGPGRFGAYYTTLKYDEAWDKPWRIGPDADVIVRFDNAAHKFVFWRGTSYIPCWVTDTDIWYTNEFVERRGSHSPNTEGCVEPMSDKQCRFSHVRIIENTDARVVVHWRYAPVDVHYNHPFIHPETGWSDWVDEYYTIYPDSIGVRKITAHTTRPDMFMEWHEAIVINQPGTRPEDNIELGAVSVANMKGKSRTYVWNENGSPLFDDPIDANIMKINLKAKHKPFAIIPPTSQKDIQVVRPYKGHGIGSFFNFWDHWPVAQEASDGRKATSANRPSHSSVAQFGKIEGGWEYYGKGEDWLSKVLLHGMTDKPVEDLIPLAKSWVNAPILEIEGKTYSSNGFEPAERAYQITNTTNKEGKKLELRILADEEHPIVNPAFVINNWGHSNAALKLDGKKVKQGNTFRLGHRQTLEGTDLIVWIRTESTKPVQLVLQ